MLRNVCLLWIFCGFLLCTIGCGAGDGKVASIGTPSPATAASEIRVYEVFGMDCPGCHGGLEKLVKKIPAIQQAEGNWEKKQLLVVIRPGAELKDEDIHDAVRRSNFTPGKRIR